MAGAGGATDLALPPICRHFNAPTGCRRPDCRAIHVCFYFVTSQCRFGVRCRLPHTLETERTAALLRQLGWPAGRRQPVQLLNELRRRHSSGDSGGCSSGGPAGDSPPVCLHFNGSGCLAAECGSLHICYLYVRGRCSGRRCRRPFPRSHDLTTVHNMRVLALRGLTGHGAAVQVLDRLRRETAERPLRPAVCRRYNSRDGCPAGDCLQLHCCFYFARGDCAYGIRCRLDHILSSAHNLRVLQFFDQEAADALLTIREELPGARTGTASVGAPSAATEPAQLQLDAGTARLLSQQDQLEQTLSTVVRLNSETEQELVISRQAGRALQVQAEHVSLVAQERERQLSE